MSTQAIPNPLADPIGQTEAAIPVATPTESAAHWSLATRIAFRFTFIYFSIFCLFNGQIISSLIPFPANLPDLSIHFPVRQLVFWTATHIFHVQTELVYKDSGSGDKTWDWVLTFCLLIIAAAATALWSALDSKRENYVTLHKWFRVSLRFALASQMLLYGLAKAVPLQMPFPQLTRLLEPYGRFSPMAVLWSSIGASPSYEIFAGCAEVFGGILLFFPRTALFGALVCLADMTQVFMLNMTYDIPVKLFAFHLILMSLVLLAPEFRRLLSFFFLNRQTEPSTQPSLLRSAKANRIAVALQAVFGLSLLLSNIYGSWKAWHTYGAGRPKPSLYGIWDIDEFSQDGALRAAVVTDNDRFRRAVFDFANSMAFQKMDDTFTGYGANYIDSQKRIVLSKSSDKNFKGDLSYTRETHDGQDQLTLTGEMDGHKLNLKLHRVDHTKFMLSSRGFHWIQEYPFNK
jgi:uncharacterized membrane protein YphA (DoxX/SURF4 family)